MGLNKVSNLSLWLFVLGYAMRAKNSKILSARLLFGYIRVILNRFCKTFFHLKGNCKYVDSSLNMRKIGLVKEDIWVETSEMGIF